MIRSDFLAGHWKPYLLRALTLQPCYNGPINGGEVSFSTDAQYLDVFMSELACNQTISVVACIITFAFMQNQLPKSTSG
jgi:hypothetical protein